MALMVGCAPLGPRLTFPQAALRRDANDTWYDVNRDGRADFALQYETHGRVESLAYDDDEDGEVDRAYRLADYANERVPHLVLLLDSIPFEVMAKRYEAGGFRFMDPPVKVIPPFPSLTELCYTRVLHAAPLVGVADMYFDAETGKMHDGFQERAMGWRQPWERRLSYHARYLEASFTYMDPAAWLPIEMGRIRNALNSSGQNETIVYAVTASGMACKYGESGMQRTLDAAEQLCLQLLYERRGAIRITMMADHGHNLTPSRTATPAIASALKSSGFRLGDRMRNQRDVVIELAALVDYVGMRTRMPREVAEAATRAKEVELACWLEGKTVVVRDRERCSGIDFRDGAFRYREISGDVLGYRAVVESLRKAGKISSDGFAPDRDWFLATVDHHYPDACRRLWDAFHGLVISPPDVMLTLHDGWYAGESGLERFIEMASTHGSLDQRNSATFVMTMHKPLDGVLRSDEVMRAISPGKMGGD